MDRILGAQASEVFLPPILEEEVGVERVDLLDGYVVGAGARCGPSLPFPSRG